MMMMMMMMMTSCCHGDSMPLAQEKSDHLESNITNIVELQTIEGFKISPP
jgi:hypothetical protein